MLDDSTYIGNLDHGNGLGIIAGQPAQLSTKFGTKVPKLTDLQQIVVVGMGGSALAAEVVRSWLVDRLPVPIEIVRGYDLPAYIGKQSLVILSSYSGNTEETLAAAHQALGSKATLAVIASGGKLSDLAAMHKLPLFTLTSGYQPRLAIQEAAKAFAVIIEQQGLAKGIVKELEATADWLRQTTQSWGVAVPTADNAAKQIAEQLHGNILVAYAGPKLAVGAMLWKIAMNENAKNLAFWNQYSEFNHNEFLGWLNPKVSNFKVVQLRSSLDGERIAKRFDLSNRLLSGNQPAPITVEAAGETQIQQLLWSIMLGDMVAGYVALLNGIDPIPVALIERLKQELG